MASFAAAAFHPSKNPAEENFVEPTRAKRDALLLEMFSGVLKNINECVFHLAETRERPCVEPIGEDLSTAPEDTSTL